MNNYDKILNYVKENNGYITTKDFESLEIIVEILKDNKFNDVK